MKWVCPNCGTIWSIIDIDLPKWEKMTRCKYCPPAKKIVRTSEIGIKIDPLKDLKPLENENQSTDLDQSFEADYEDHLDILPDNVISGEKAFVNPDKIDKIGDVTDDVTKKQFREKGYEGKKSGRAKRGRKKK